MPTARELLEQADALMRRNRGGDGGIPVLTEVVEEESATASHGPLVPRERAGPTTRGPIAETRAPRERTEREPSIPAPAAAREERKLEAIAPETEASEHGLSEADRRHEPPILTDAVEESALDDLFPPAEIHEGAPSLWLGPDSVDPALHSVTGPAPDTLGVVPPITIRAAEAPADAGERDPSATRTLRAAGSEPTPPPSGSVPPGPVEPAALVADANRSEATSDEARWRALSEQISMQVLQRLDLFIDSGLKAQLASHLQPIVARASAELVTAINDHVGQLVRAYVAEAIEREIAQWRKQQQ
jgi:hypothetical protein